MNGKLTIAVIIVATLVASPLRGFAQSGSPDGRETLTRALRTAWLPLESGVVASAGEGTPLSAKYEIDDGAFQLSVYTWTVGAWAGDSFLEVIVDHSTGSVIRAEAITDGGDLAAAQAQRAAMAGAKRSLAEATGHVVKKHPGFRAVSTRPSLAGGRPVLEITLVRGDEWTVVTEPLD